MDSLNRIPPTTPNRMNNSPNTDNLKQEKKLFDLPPEIQNQILSKLEKKDLINLSIAERGDLEAWHNILGNDINEGHIVATMMKGPLPEPAIINRLIPCIPILNFDNVTYKLPIEIVLNDLGAFHNEKCWNDEAIFNLADKLISHGAKVPLVKFNKADNEFNNAVSLMKGNSVVDLYLHLKRNPQILLMKDSNGNSLLHLAITTPTWGSIVAVICREEGVDYSLRNLAGDTPLSHAAKNWLIHSNMIGNINIVLEHSLNKFDLEEQNNQGFNILHLLSKYNYNDKGKLTVHWNYARLQINYISVYAKVVKTLRDSGFNLSSLSREGYSPLKYAIDNDNIPLALTLLDNGAQFANEAEKTQALTVIAKRQGEIIDPNDECTLYRKPTLQVLNDVIAKINKTITVEQVKQLAENPYDGISELFSSLG